MMNHMFRIATRALCFGLLAALSLVLIVSAQGIRPEVLVTFQPAFQSHSPETLLATAPAPLQVPEQFAQLEPATRLDAPATERIALNSNSRPAKSPKFRLGKAERPVKLQPLGEPELPQLPPVPESPVEDNAEAPEQPPAQTLEQSEGGPPPDIEMLAQPAENDAPAEVETTPDKASFEPSESTESPSVTLAVPKTPSPEASEFEPSETQLAQGPTQHEPQSPVERKQTVEASPPPTSRRITNRPSTPPVANSSSIKKITANSDTPHAPHGDDKSPNPTSPTASISPTTPGLEERLESLQRQLKTLTTEQEQQRLTYQSWLATTQSQQQQQLKSHLEGIEATLRELKSRADQAPPKSGPTEPYIQRADGKDRKPTHPSAPVIREERPDADGERRFSIESHQTGLRELLDALAHKANLNVILSINVEGDVELSLQNATTEQALAAIQKSTGYVVEKSGQRVYIRPGDSKRYQREEFLPPIVKEHEHVPPVTAP